jgi:hypothetical protein
MTTKMSEALRYFEPVVQEVDRILTIMQQDLMDPGNQVYLTELLTRLRKGWDVLGNQIIVASHCLKCNDTHVVSVNTSPAMPCPDCSVGTSVDEQFAEIDQNRQWVAKRLLEKEWTCLACGELNPTATGGACCRRCQWRPCG